MAESDVTVSYPTSVNLGFEVIPLPIGLSTLFVITWRDKSGEDTEFLQAQTHHRHLVIHKALSEINKILQAYKLVRMGHVDAAGVRTIGKYDTLFYYSTVNDVPTGGFNAGLKFKISNSKSASPFDQFGTTEIAMPHIGKLTYPVARRFLRCYELLEHGFFSESFIIAFSIMDDLVQEMLKAQLQLKGMADKSDRDSLLRSIKESRLKLYLGPLLKIISGRSISEIWSNSERAIDWVNKIRNNIAHGGLDIDYNYAAVGIYACIKLLHVLHVEKIISAEFPVEFFRNAKLTASWTKAPPDWVPTGSIAESMDFNS